MFWRFKWTKPPSFDNTYTLINNTVNDVKFKHQHRLSDTSFERSRKLSCPTLIRYFLDLNKGSYQQAITIRMVRVDLDNEVEVLITNLLDSETYSAEEFKALYHLRWGIEENYKRLKQWVEIENFSGKSALSVKQDFYA